MKRPSAPKAHILDAALPSSLPAWRLAMARCLSAPLLLISLTSLAAPQATPNPERVRIVDTIISDQLVVRVAPIYPPLARQARIQDTVVLDIVIDKSGGVQNVEKVSGHPLLAPAAIEAVKQWRYTPYLLNGDPVEVETNVAVRFTLSDKPAAGVAARDAPGSLPSATLDSVKTTDPQGPSDPTPPTRVRVSESVMQTLLIQKVDPVAPSEPGIHIQGSVVLKAVINKSGNMQSLQLVSGHPMLMPAALEAARQWKYQPFLLNGDPVEVETTVHVDFAKPRSR
jgi:TonB family protein